MSTTRDAHGIAHVVAPDALTLAFEQGRACAIDRRWQLEIERLRGEGRTAELVGSGGVEWDRIARRARLRETAEQAFAAASSETQEFVTAYVEGVRSALPDAPCAELDRLGPAPGLWEPWTPMAIWLVQHLLFGAFGHHLWRRRVRREMPAAEPFFWTGGESFSGGSNAFVIGADRTASGFPILAGDPHRRFEAPNVYAQVRLSCPDFDVLGVAFPGVPGVQHFGHTGEVAWAVTNAMADQQGLAEVAREACLERAEQILVRDADPVTFRAWESEHGPGLLVDGDTVLCLSGPSYDDGSMLDPILPLLRARSVGDVDAALERWVEPVNNFLITDRGGRALHRVAGQFGAPLPRIEGTADGVLVTANNAASPAFAVLGDRFAPPFRAARIAELLSQPRRWTPADAAAVLTDVRLDHPALLDRIAKLSADDLGARGRHHRARLLAWDRQLAADSHDAGLYVQVRDALVRSLAAHEMLEGLADPTVYGTLWSPWLWLSGRIASTLPAWLALDQPLGIDLDALLADALDIEPETGPWGARHRYGPQHALSDLGVRHGFAPAVAGAPLAGDSDCVAATVSLPGLGESVVGPVLRYVWDLADRGASRWAVPLGAHGDHRSTHHDDQFDAWASGELLPVPDTMVGPA